MDAILAANFGITSTGRIHTLECINLCSHAVPTSRDLRLGARPARCCVKPGTAAAATWDSMGDL
jgi:hypothetical protein